MLRLFPPIPNSSPKYRSHMIPCHSHQMLNRPITVLGPPSNMWVLWNNFHRSWASPSARIVAPAPYVPCSLHSILKVRARWSLGTVARVWPPFSNSVCNNSTVIWASSKILSMSNWQTFANTRTLSIMLKWHRLWTRLQLPNLAS